MGFFSSPFKSVAKGFTSLFSGDVLKPLARTGAGAVGGFAVGGPVGAAVGAGLGFAGPSITDFFKPPKIPGLPPPPAVPTRANQAAALDAARKKRRLLLLRRRGRRSTILTGPAGVLSDAPLSQPRAGSALTLGG